MRLFILSVFTLFSLTLTGQQNINLELVANVATPSSANDIWGYVDQNGIEYAIVGTVDNTNIYSLQDPTAPELLLTIEGTNTVWRDMKSRGAYVYSVTDRTSDGLTIIDMSSPLDSIPFTNYFPTFTFDTTELTIVNAHNLYIDENGILCMTGGNVLDGAPVLLDIAANPTEPEVVGYVPGPYSHDIYIRDNILYSSEIFEGSMSIYDITDKQAPVKLGSVLTSFEFTHNAWLSDDGNFIFTTDERTNAYVDAYDISDKQNIKRVSSIRSRANGGQVIPHNTHYHEGYLVTSWYGDGVVVIDANKPDNLVIVGRYDTNPDESMGFVGCWGAYPFLPSGLVLGSDRQYGLYVLRPEYKRASYFEGCVVDGVTGLPLDSVEITIPNTSVRGFTNVMGNFRSGHSAEGVTEIVFAKNGYQVVFTEADLVSGEVTDMKIEMFPAQLQNLTVRVVDAISGAEVSDAQVEVDGVGYDVDFLTDANGSFNTDVFVGNYNFTIGAWGYLHQVSEVLVQADELVFELQPGYQDDFYFDLDWTQSADTDWNLKLDGSDVNFDLGNEFYQNFRPDNEGGLTSPAMDLSSYDYPIIRFSGRLFTSGANLIPTLVIDGQKYPAYEINDTDFVWERFQVSVFNVVPTDTDLSEVYFLFDTELTPDIDLMDVDAFLVEDGQPSSLEELDQEEFIISPNPVVDVLSISALGKSMIRELEIYDLNGSLIRSEKSNLDTTIKINVANLSSGVYMVKIIDQDGAASVMRFMRQ